MSLPKTEDAKLCNDDHDESRKSAAPREDDAWENPFQLNGVASLRVRLAGSVTRDGCFMGNGDVPREDRGDGVAPRERVVPTSADNVVDRPEAKG